MKIFNFLILIIILLSSLIFYFANQWIIYTNSESDIFTGLAGGPVENLILNSLNGAITSYLPSQYNNNFIDWRQIIPEAQLLIDNFDTIKEELNNIMKDYKNIPSFDDIDYNQANLIVNDNKFWKTFVFKYYNDFNENNCQKCPKTAKILKKLPLDLAMFSIMEKGKILEPHRGPWRGSLRLHFGLDIPNGSKLIVNNQVYEWKEKELVLFDDTFIHSVENGNDRRVILFMDIKREHIPSFFHDIIGIAGRKYLNEVNKNIEKKSLLMSS